MKEFSLNRIEEAFNWLQNEFSDTDVQHSIDDLHIKQNAINSVVSWSYEQMAVAKKMLNDAKEKAYLSLSSSSVANQQYYAPSLAKEYIASRCSNEAYAYDLTERLCRACVHISDNLRTSISAMKELARMESLSNSQY